MNIQQVDQGQQPQYVTQPQGVVNQGYAGQTPQAEQQQQPQIYANYQSKQSLILGILHVIVGLLCIGFGGGALGNAFRASVAHGIWGGVFFIITGAFAIVASKRKDYRKSQRELWLAMKGVLSCLFIIELALTIWSAVMCGVLCGASGDCSTDCGCYGDSPQYPDPGTQLQFPVSTISAAAPQTQSEGTAAAQQAQITETPDEEQPPKYQDQL
ncbi:hypothetical protein CAPTEDRAFT_185386 [Capitella teleta]|uniref:Uncharacterized protein n=1 Tax=Capitella teleta TaxID=283909 RepID=R7TAV1_CAPTE|nr:hypothetical protein CAPTEDRAFT_185386 [Capitella teleta]|eukprot:ELT90814.1 hypothetical protein CAPTEDRAFT_185386 [Capitella teleta]